MGLKQLTSIDYLYIYDPYIFADSVEVLPSGPDEEYELEIEEATEEGEEESQDDTLIPDTNNLNHQTESTGTITYLFSRHFLKLSICNPSCLLKGYIPTFLFLFLTASHTYSVRFYY